MARKKHKLIDDMKLLELKYSSTTSDALAIAFAITSAFFLLAFTSFFSSDS